MSSHMEMILPVGEGCADKEVSTVVVKERDNKRCYLFIKCKT